MPHYLVHFPDVVVTANNPGQAWDRARVRSQTARPGAVVPCDEVGRIMPADWRGEFQATLADLGTFDEHGGWYPHDDSPVQVNPAAVAVAKALTVTRDKGVTVTTRTRTRKPRVQAPGTPSPGFALAPSEPTNTPPKP